LNTLSKENRKGSNTGIGNPKNTTGMKIFVYEASRRPVIELCGNKVADNKQAPLIIPNIEAIIIRTKEKLAAFDNRQTEAKRV
jgi:hypothetical protein